MKYQNNVGFTLIELLVVVLIIGILAAIALPQYTKAVERSRTAEAIQRLGDMATAQQVYYMQYGSFADESNLKDLGDITFSTFNTNSYTVGVDAGTAGVTMTATRINGKYGGKQIALAVAPDGGIKKNCIADETEFCGLVTSAGYKKGSWD